MGILDSLREAFGNARPVSGDWDSCSLDYGNYYGDSNSDGTTIVAPNYEPPVTSDQAEEARKKAKKEAEEQALDASKHLSTSSIASEDLHASQNNHQTYNDLYYELLYGSGPRKKPHTSFTPMYISLGFTAIFTIVTVTLLGPILDINTPIDRLIDFFTDNNLDCKTDHDCSSITKLKHVEFTNTEKDIFLGGAITAGAGAAASTGSAIFYGRRAHQGRQEKAAFEAHVEDLANQFGLQKHP
jgi:hypothetical protein